MLANAAVLLIVWQFGLRERHFATDNMDTGSIEKCRVSRFCLGNYKSHSTWRRVQKATKSFTGLIELSVSQSAPQIVGLLTRNYIRSLKAYLLRIG